MGLNRVIIQRCNAKKHNFDECVKYKGGIEGRVKYDPRDKKIGMIAN